MRKVLVDLFGRVDELKLSLLGSDAADASGAGQRAGTGRRGARGVDSVVDDGDGCELAPGLGGEAAVGDDRGVEALDRHTGELPKVAVRQQAVRMKDGAR